MKFLIQVLLKGPWCNWSDQMSCKNQLLVSDLMFILPSLAPGGVCVCWRWKQPSQTLWSTASWCWLTGSTAGLNSAVPKDRSVPEKQWLQGWALLWTLSTLPPCPELWSPRSLSPCHERCCHTKSLYIDIWQVWRSDRNWENLWSW